MRQIKPDPAAMNRLMMGPDGEVHVIPAGTRKDSTPPREMEVRPGAQQAGESGRAYLPANVAKRDAELLGVRRMPEVGACFSYSAALPPSDRDAARRALRDIRRMPEVGVCFSYSATTPPSDRSAAQRALRDVRRVPGDGGVCFSY